jgi:HTH-type transcriptional regulator, sugar sensing transcriptional regulator
MATVEIQPSVDRECRDVYYSIQTVLKKFGLTPNELKVYNHLIENGPKTANNMGKDLDIYRTETYRLLNSLQNKGMISIIFDKPAKFVGINYDKALDLLINTQIENLNQLRSMRDFLLKSDIVV